MKPLKALLSISAFLARYTSAFVILMGALAFLRPQIFSWVHGDAQTAVLGVIMLAMGMTLSKSDFAILARNPIAIAIGAIAQYTIMPLLAFGIAHALHLDPALATGLILVGCSPGGVSSNIMSFLCKGDVALSVGMTTVSTLLAPIATPLLVLHLSGQEIAVDAYGMFRSILVVTVLPVTLGIILNTLMGRTKFYGAVLGLMPGIAVIGLGCIVGGVIAADGEFFLRSGLAIFVAVFLHNTGGYILGYLAAKVTRMNRARRRTLAIEVGMQNAGLATVLAHKHFAALPGAEVISAVSCVWHSVTGALVAGLFVKLDKRRQTP